MIDLASESPVPISEASREIPNRPNLSTVYRWFQRGIRGGVKLETCLIGGRRFTSREAIQRFVDRLTAAAAGEQPTIRSPRQRQRAIERATKELAAAGI